MASVQVVSPFEIFTDVDGNPLEDGFVYIGQAGVDPIANPVSTFFDSALTVPAPQPIRTKGGYASNAGVPSRVFIAQNAYSTLVKNKNSFQILLSLTSPPAFLVGPASSTDNELPLFSGTDGNTLKGTGTIVTAQGRALLDDATAAAQRTTLGLGTAAVTNQTISNLDVTPGNTLKVGDYGWGAPGSLTPTYTVTPANLNNVSPSAAIQALNTDSQATVHSPVSGESFGGVSVVRGIRPGQFGVSGVGATATFWYRGYSTASSLLADWLQVQTQDNDLQALANNSTNGLWARTGAGTGSARTITGTANEITVTNGDGVAGAPTLSVPTSLNYAGKTFTNAGIMTTVDINGGTLDGVVIGGASAAAATFTTTSQTTATVSTSINLTGGQIAFPATQVPSAGANVLDDYEEGTWTMVITFATQGDLAVVYSSQSGRYTKIGRGLMYEGTVTTTTFTYTTATGTLQITGLPFSPASGVPAVTLARWTGVVSAVATPQIVSLVNATTILFEVMNVAAGTTASLTQANAASGVQKSIFLSGSYATA